MALLARSSFSTTEITSSNHPPVEVSMTIRGTFLSASLLALVALVGAPPGQARPKTKAESDKESEARMRKDLFFLASAKCEGRGPTTKGLVLAGDHIAAQFKQIGLKPGFKGSY